MLKITKIVSQRDDFPLDGESYIVGQVEDGRYFFSWGWSYPENGELTEEEVTNGVDGFQYYETEEKALRAMETAVEAREMTK